MANKRLEDKRLAINNWILIDLKFLLVLCVFYFLLLVFNETCPIKAIFAFECPTCGATRALVSLFGLDFEGYFTYNALALPLAIILYLNLHAEIFKKKILMVGTILTAIFVLALYIIKLTI